MLFLKYSFIRNLYHIEIRRYDFFILIEAEAVLCWENKTGLSYFF